MSRVNPTTTLSDALNKTHPPLPQTDDSKLEIYLRLLAYGKPYWRLFLLSTAGYLIFAATQPMLASLMKYAVDSIQTRRQNAAYAIPLAMMGIMLMRGVGTYLGNYYFSKVSNNVIHTLRCQLFDHYTLLPVDFFDNHSAGHLLNRLNHNISIMTTSVTASLKVILRESFTVIGLLLYLFYLNWALSLIFLVIAPIIGVIVIYTNKRFRRLGKNIEIATGTIMHVATELVTGHRIVRSFGGEHYEKERFHALSKYTTRQAMKMAQTSSLHTPALQFIVTLALAVLIFLALTIMSEASAGEFIAYITAAIFMPKPIRQLSEINGTIQRGIAAAEIFFLTLDEKPEVDKGTYSAAQVEGKIEIKNLSFAYDNADGPVLNNISFTIQPGQVVALVGPSGAGKSTLANLIPRFYDYKNGSILLDGIELNHYTLKNLRSHIALVTQQVTLFNDTVRNNIAYGDLSGASPEEVIQAATAANAMEFIGALPKGLDTLIGDNGVKLSGGQRQRLAIARALLKNAPILILDEATSALDTESERKIQEALEIAVQGRTTLVIAHRLSTIEKADVILVMDNGRIVESGDHKTLLAQGGIYAKLHQIGFREPDKRERKEERANPPPESIF